MVHELRSSLRIVLKFEFDHPCFQREASTYLVGKWNKKTERR